MCTRASTEPRQASSRKEPTGASAGDLPQTIEKQMAHVQGLKSLTWMTCLGSSEDPGNCEGVREGLPGEELEPGFERCLGWHKRREGGRGTGST